MKAIPKKNVEVNEVLRILSKNYLYLHLVPFTIRQGFALPQNYGMIAPRNRLLDLLRDVAPKGKERFFPPSFRTRTNVPWNGNFLLRFSHIRSIMI